MMSRLSYAAVSADDNGCIASTRGRSSSGDVRSITLCDWWSVSIAKLDFKNVFRADNSLKSNKLSIYETSYSF